jgi:tetrahydromethanopterin S-methyltransferase subunit D
MKKVVFQAKNVRIFLAAAFVLAALATIRPLGARPRFPLAWLAAEAGLTGLFLAAPKLFFPVYKVLLLATGALGAFLFALISLVVFYLVMTPIALVLRLFGKSFMKVRTEAGLATYFEDGADGADITRQF